MINKKILFIIYQIQEQRTKKYRLTSDQILNKMDDNSILFIKNC